MYELPLSHQPADSSASGCDLTGIRTRKTYVNFSGAAVLDCTSFVWRPCTKRAKHQITPRCSLVAQALGVSRRRTEVYTAHQGGSRPRPMRQSLSRSTLCCGWLLKSGSRIAAMCEQYENGLIESIRKCIDFSPGVKKPARWRAWCECWLYSGFSSLEQPKPAISEFVQ